MKAYNCGSIINGHRVAFVRMIAFSVDIRSFGRPSLCHVAIVASSQIKFIESILSVCGISGCQSRKNIELFFNWNALCVYFKGEKFFSYYFKFSERRFPYIFLQFMSIHWSESTDIRYKACIQKHIAGKFFNLIT